MGESYEHSPQVHQERKGVPHAPETRRYEDGSVMEVERRLGETVDLNTIIGAIDREPVIGNQVVYLQFIGPGDERYATYLDGDTMVSDLTPYSVHNVARYREALAAQGKPFEVTTGAAWGAQFGLHGSKVELVAWPGVNANTEANVVKDPRASAPTVIGRQALDKALTELG